MSQNKLLKLLEDAPQAGIFHLPGVARRQSERLPKRGLRLLSMSVSRLDRIDIVLSRLGALDFPEWYGHNFDALKDCLTDFSWCEAAATC
jgi:hypothetical protein